MKIIEGWMLKHKLWWIRPNRNIRAKALELLSFVKMSN
jgi:hypothetical protein